MAAGEQWRKDVLRLKESHTWKAKPGFQVFVADRGAVCFHIPQGWVIKPGASSIAFYDREPAEDANCRLEMSLLRLPPLDWSELSLVRLQLNLMTESQSGSGRKSGG